MAEMRAKQNLTFGDVRNYASRVDRISICMAKTQEYNNYSRMQDVPHTYDNLYLHGFGMIESEAKGNDPATADQGLLMIPHLEFYLSDEP